MSEDYFEDERDDQSWAQFEQAFMRFMGVALMVIAVVSMIFGVFPVDENAPRVVQSFNVVLTLLLGIGSLWSLYWSSDMQRIYNLIDGFKEKGSTPTYISAGIQVFVGVLFGTELLSGHYAAGLIGVLMLISAVFFLWRAQQISHYRATM